jgi:hypothetical protein
VNEPALQYCTINNTFVGSGIDNNQGNTMTTNGDLELGDADVPLKSASINHEPKIELDTVHGNATDSSQDLASNLTSTVTPSHSLPRKRQQEREATMQTKWGSTSSTYRHLQLDGAPKKKGLHRSKEDLQAKLNAIQGKCTATSQDLPASNVAQSLPRKGLRRTPEERTAKRPAKSTSASTTAMHLRLDSAYKKRGGLRRTQDEIEAKLPSIRGKHVTSNDLSTSALSQSLPHMPGKGLHRTPEERETKMQALLGSTRSSSAARKDNGINGTPSSTRTTLDPPIWVNASDSLEEDQFQESSTIVADLNQGTHGRAGLVYPPANLLAVSQYLNSVENRTSGRTASSQLATRLPTSVLDMVPTTTGSNVGLVEARAVIEESTGHILQEAQQVDAYRLSISLENQAEKERKERQCRRIGYCLITGSLIVISLSLGIGLGLGKADTGNTAIVPSLSPSMTPSSVPSSAPTSYLDLLYDTLPDYTQKSLQNYSTPQWNAFDWLSNHQNISHLPEWRKKQLFAFATFFYAMQGPSWNKKIRNDWMDETKDECNWFSNQFGMFDLVTGQWNESANYSTCNTNGELRHLALQDLQLSGLEPSIPPEIVFLSSLESIYLSECNITTSLHHFLPSELYQMTNLITLSVSSNGFTGVIPSKLGLLINLSVLILWDNGLKGKLPLAELCCLIHPLPFFSSITHFQGVCQVNLGC